MRNITIVGLGVLVALGTVYASDLPETLREDHFAREIEDLAKRYYVDEVPWSAAIPGGGLTTQSFNKLLREFKVKDPEAVRKAYAEEEIRLRKLFAALPEASRESTRKFLLQRATTYERNLTRARKLIKELRRLGMSHSERLKLKDRINRAANRANKARSEFNNSDQLALLNAPLFKELDSLTTELQKLRKLEDSPSPLRADRDLAKKAVEKKLAEIRRKRASLVVLREALPRVRLRAREADNGELGDGDVPQSDDRVPDDTVAQEDPDSGPGLLLEILERANDDVDSLDPVQVERSKE